MVGFEVEDGLVACVVASLAVSVLFQGYIFGQVKTQVTSGKIIMPAYVPILVALIVMTFMLCLLTSFCWYVRPGDSDERSLALLGSGCFGLVLHLILVVFLKEASITLRSLFHACLRLVPYTAVNLTMWLLMYIEVVEAKWFMWLYFAVAGAPPILYDSLVMGNVIKSRIQLASRSHRSCVVLSLFHSVAYAALVLLFILDVSPRVFQIAFVCLKAPLHLLFPYATRQTLAADTKFWVGRGQHNQGGLRAKEDNAQGKQEQASVAMRTANNDLQEFLSQQAGVFVDYGLLDIGKKLGSGSTAEVFQGSLRGKEVAIKVFSPPELESGEIQRFSREAALSKTLQHINVVGFHGMCVRPPQVAMVFELCHQGNLQSLLKMRRNWTVRRRYRAAIDAAAAVEYLHQRAPPVIHRDLKAENFFVDENFIVKLGDFGESTLFAALQGERRAMTIVGTVSNMAPELIEGQKFYTEAVDIYALGVTLWEIWTGEVPFKEFSQFQLYKEVLDNDRRPPVPDDCPEGYRTVMEQMWNKDPDQRPSASEARLKLYEALEAYLNSDEYAETDVEDMQLDHMEEQARSDALSHLRAYANFNTARASLASVFDRVGTFVMRESRGSSVDVSERNESAEHAGKVMAALEHESGKYARISSREWDLEEDGEPETPPAAAKVGVPMTPAAPLPAGQPMTPKGPRPRQPKGKVSHFL